MFSRPGRRNNTGRFLPPKVRRTVRVRLLASAWPGRPVPAAAATAWSATGGSLRRRWWTWPGPPGRPRRASGRRPRRPPSPPADRGAPRQHFAAAPGSTGFPASPRRRGGGAASVPPGQEWLPLAKAAWSSSKNRCTGSAASCCWAWVRATSPKHAQARLHTLSASGSAMAWISTREEQEDPQPGGQLRQVGRRPLVPTHQGKGIPVPLGVLAQCRPCLR